LISCAYHSTQSFFNEMSSKLEGKEKVIAEKTATNLYNLAYGVTFDKTIVLKILSQPNCEGLRSYLCARKLTDGSIHYSLVMVGVDCNGFDLNYPPACHTPKQNKNLTLGDNTVVSESLVGEYGNPPGGSMMLKLNSDDPTNEHYYILKQAIGH
jgi:hypothetical protein